MPPPPAVFINLTGQKFQSRSLSNRAGEYAITAGSLEIVASIETMGELYIELRRMLGELGGAGPSRVDVRNTVRRLNAAAQAVAKPAAPETPKFPATPAELSGMQMVHDAGEPAWVPAPEDDGLDAPAVRKRP